MGTLFNEIKALHPDLSEGTKGWWRCNSDAEHTDKTLCFNFDTLWVNDFRSGLSCSIMSYLRSHGIVVDQSYYANTLVKLQRRGARTEVALPAGFKLIGTIDDYLGARIIKYVCEQRAIPIEIAQEALIGYVSDKASPWFGYVIFPNISLGRLTYLSGRAFLGGYNKHKNETSNVFNRGSADTLYNENALYRKHSELYIQEGCFDVLTMYPNAVGSYKWKLSTEQFNLLLKHAGSYVIAPDRGFLNEAKALALKLLQHRRKVKILRLPYTDKLKDVNDLGADVVRYVASTTEYLTYATLNER